MNLIWLSRVLRIILNRICLILDITICLCLILLCRSITPAHLLITFIKYFLFKLFPPSRYLLINKILQRNVLVQNIHQKIYEIIWANKRNIRPYFFENWLKNIEPWLVLIKSHFELTIFDNIFTNAMTYEERKPILSFLKNVQILLIILYILPECINFMSTIYSLSDVSRLVRIIDNTPYILYSIYTFQTLFNEFKFNLFKISLFLVFDFIKYLLNILL
jgi:hypothetical protein